jgi:hypothetical protein
LRNEGWFDDATASYQALAQLVPDEPAAVVRLALGHAGAGRLDVARRLLQRVTETGGRTGDDAFRTLGAELSSVWLVRALAAGPKPPEAQRLSACLRQSPPPSQGIVLVESAAASLPVLARLTPRPTSVRPERALGTLAPGLGLGTLEFDPVADLGAKLVVSHRKAARATKVRITTLVAGGPDALPRLTEMEFELSADGRAIELEWQKNGWRRL